MTDVAVPDQLRELLRAARDGAVVACDTEAAEALAERLARFVFRYDVRVGAPRPGGLTLLGPAAGQASPPTGPDAVGFPTELGLDVLGPAAASGSAGMPAGLPVVGPGVLEALRIERGLPRWGRPREAAGGPGPGRRRPPRRQLEGVRLLRLVAQVDRGQLAQQGRGVDL